MTRPTESAEHIDAGALHEVQDAYRALPPAEPGAALDARVRAAVAAELARATPADAEAPRATAKVIAFPWWRRASLPLAAAATLMVAVGLGRMWFVDGLSDRAPDSAYEPAPVAVQEAPAPVPEAPATAADAAPAESREARVLPQTAKPAESVAPPITEAAPAPKAFPQKADTRAEEDAVVFRGLDRAAPPPPAEAEAKAEAKAEAATQADSARRARSAESLNAAPAMAPPAPVQAAKPAASEVPAAKAMQKRAISADMAAPLDAETFDEVRRLLREQHPDEARALLKRWRDAHPGVTLPEDLRALAAEPDRAP